MDYKPIDVEIEGVLPTLMHNGQLANPFNPFTRAMKEITSKRKKTDEDLIDLMKAEFMGGLYVDEKGRPAWPGENLIAMIKSGAKISRGGVMVRQGLMCAGTWPLIYDGPKTAEGLWENKDFVDYRGAGVNNNRVMRTRPIFKKWSLKFQLMYLPQVIENSKVIMKWLEDAGVRIGLGDHPDMGRFIVKKFKEV